MNQTFNRAVVLACSLAVGAEGLRHYAYYDPPGILTACRGHTGTDVVKGKFYSLEQCDAWLTADMKAAITTVDRCAPNLPASVLAAFGDAVYNSGPKIACSLKESTAARFLKAGDIVSACKQLPRWVKAKVLGVWVTLPGLVTRRNLEMQVCLGGQDDGNTD